MGILRVHNLSKSFGIEELFRDVNFDIARGDKVGFIGANGAGKTTLMRCMMGLAEADGGSVELDAAETVGYVEQEALLGEWSLWEELRRAFADVLAWQDEMKELEQRIADSGEAEHNALLKTYADVVERFENAGGYTYETRIRRVAFGLGFGEDDFLKSVGQFSGGQKTRICLAKALIREPDYLFLDEPTNHLDIGMVEWLEEFLQSYGGGVLLISHDRFFLDRVANRVIELENKTATLYDGNYTAFASLKAARRAALENAYGKQQTHIQKTEDYIRKYKAGIKSKQARGREKQLNRLRRIVLPPNSVGFNYFAFNPPSECAQRVAEFEEITAAYGDKTIFARQSLLVKNGDGVALVGPNGAGKTTLLKILVGELEPKEGRVKLGSRVQLGYFSQQHEGLNFDNCLMDELTYGYGITEEQARRYLGAFLFRGDDVYRRIGELSGGEKSRLAFLKLMLTGANFLVLDEPTNHLDIPAKEAVEEALMAYPGTFVAVSHDRYFLDKVTNCTVELDGGALTEYGGNYSYYHDKKLQAVKSEAAVPVAKEKPATQTPRPQRAPARRMQDKTKLARQYEGEIAMLEMEIKGLEVRLNDPAVQSDPEASHAIAREYDAAQKALSEKYDLWAACAGEDDN